MRRSSYTSSRNRRCWGKIYPAHLPPSGCLELTRKLVFENIRNTGKASGESLQTLHDGRKLFISYDAYLLHGEQEQPIGYISILRNTESLLEQQQLRKQAMLLDLASDAIYVADLTGKITYWNQGAQRLYGWSPLEAVGRDANDLLKSKFDTSCEQLDSELLRTGNCEAEVVHHRKDGEPITVSSRWSFLRDLNGLPTARMAINTDVTENRLAFEWLRLAETEAARRASELQGVLDAMPAATFIAHDPECRNITSNRAAHDMLRLSPDTNDSSLIERTSTHRFTRDGRELLKPELPLQVAASTGEPVVNSEFSIVFEDGRSLDLLGNAVPLKNEADEVRGAVGTFLDVTERNWRKSRRVSMKPFFGRCWRIRRTGLPERLRGTIPRHQFFGAPGSQVKYRRIFSGRMTSRCFRQRLPRCICDAIVRSSLPESLQSLKRRLLLDGRFRVMQTMRDLCRDAEGRVIGVVGITRDVTEHKRLAADTDGKSAATVRLFVEAIERAGDSFLVTEAEPINRPGPRITYVNDAFTRMTGYAREEVIGETPRILQGPNTDRAALNRIRAALEKWQPVREELINYRKDGSEFWVDFSIFPIANEAGW